MTRQADEKVNRLIGISVALTVLLILAVMALIVIVWLWAMDKQSRVRRGIPSAFVSGKSKKVDPMNVDTSQWRRNKYCDKRMDGTIVRLDMPRGPDNSFPSNMSHFVKDNVRYLLVRYVPYSLNADGRVVSYENNRNHVLLFSLDEKDKNPEFVSVVNESVPILQEQPMCSQGLEDIRVLLHNNIVYVSGNSLSSSKRKHYNDVFLAQLDLEMPTIYKFKGLVSPTEERVEKNWIPFVHQDKIVGIYQLHPLMVVDMERTDKFATVKFPEHNYSDHWCLELAQMRGSSNLLKIDDMYLSVFHSKFTEEKKTLYYVHYLLLLDDKMRVLKRSDPFTFEGVSVEYCMSINMDPNRRKLNFWYTIMDTKPSRMTIDYATIKWNNVE